MRINKYIAQAGIASRRKADELVAAGKVKINGAVMREPGYDVSDTDKVEVDGRVVEGTAKLVYYALYKPVGYVSTLSDEKGRPTVVSLLTDVEERVFPVGRLDYDTSGLILMTNDGALAQKIASPKNKVWKTYIAVVNEALTYADLAALRNGVEIELKEGGRTRTYKTKPAEIDVLSQSAHEAVLQIKICEGKNRQVRKMIEAVGKRVVRLQRVSIGQIQLGHTHEGGYRKLNAKELEYLKRL